MNSQSSIYFLETYTGTKIPYSKVSKANPYWRWKDLPSNLRIAYDWPEEWEEYEAYVDFVDILAWTRLQKESTRLYRE